MNIVQGLRIARTARIVAFDLPHATGAKAVRCNKSNFMMPAETEDELRPCLTNLTSSGAALLAEVHVPEPMFRL